MSRESVYRCGRRQQYGRSLSCHAGTPLRRIRSTIVEVGRHAREAPWTCGTVYCVIGSTRRNFSRIVGQMTADATLCDVEGSCAARPSRDTRRIEVRTHRRGRHDRSARVRDCPPRDRRPSSEADRDRPPATRPIRMRRGPPLFLRSLRAPCCRRPRQRRRRAGSTATREPRGRRPDVARSPGLTTGLLMDVQTTPNPRMTRSPRREKGRPDRELPGPQFLCRLGS